MSGACPCLHTTPCGADCACVSPLSSSGCRRCCSYGSAEQRAHRAARLVEVIDGHLHVENDRLRTELGVVEVERDMLRRALDGLVAQVRVQSPVTGSSDVLAEVMRRRYGREAAQWMANHEQRKIERDALRAEVEQLRGDLRVAQAVRDDARAASQRYLDERRAAEARRGRED